MRRIVSAALTIIMLFSLLSITTTAENAADQATAQTTTQANGSTEVTDNNTNEIKDFKGTSYQEYILKYKDAKKGSGEVVIDASMLTSKTNSVKLYENYQNTKGTSIYTSDNDEIEFTFDAAEGLYNIMVEYHTEKGKNISIERELKINGELPFNTAEHFNFNRVWKDVVKQPSEETGFDSDAYGNDIRPTQEEVFTWANSYFYDYLGYYSDPLEFYFKNGSNKLTLKSVKEPMTIKSIKLVPAQGIKTYEQVKSEYKDKGYKDYSGEEIKLQAEKPTFKSDQTLYPYADMSTPDTAPYKPYKMYINTIGGVRWQYAKQSITWDIAVEEAGLYAINFKSRKNIYQGMVSSRKLFINGVVPFEEVSAIPFKFSNGWTHVTPKTSDGEQCLFYLNAGKNTITLEVTQGEMGPLLRDAEEALTATNEIYRKILIVTGAEPDKYRDYKLDELMPEVIADMAVQAQKLEEIVAKIVSFTKKKGSDLATLDSMARQLRKMNENPGNIPRLLKNFKTSIGSLGTWLNTASNAPLELDYISVSAPESKIEKPTKGFINKLIYDVNQFIASFVIDYNSIGNLKKDFDKKDTITVWISTGRDQFQTLRSMINDRYTKATGQEVNLELVNMGALLPAVVAGIGPDVALGMAQNEPINFALRNAVKDLSEFEGFEEVTKRFSPQAMVPYRFNDGTKQRTFAIPETQTFSVMFYRKDVLSELGIKVPNTWEDVITAVTELNKNNLEFGMPVDLMMFYAFLRQNGGDMYEKNEMSSALHTDAASTAFKRWTNFFVNYGLPLQFDFQNRFRTGEMPIGIANYNLYNSLSVAAPEIRGLWDFTMVPGTMKENGTIDRSIGLLTSCAFILGDTNKADLSWKFLEWWTTAETQSLYGREMECIMGPSARYNTANIEAFERLPWTAHEIDILNNQLSVAYSMPEVAGGYFKERHINNAFRSVIYKSTDPKDTLLDYSNLINAEITIKREEFGLKTVSKSK